MRAKTGRRRWRLAPMTAAVAGVGLALGCGNSGHRTQAATTGRMNAPVTAEAIFEYTVTSLDCGGTVRGVVPRGRFCVVGITVHNIGDSPRVPGIAFGKAVDNRGVAYLADAVAEIRDGTALLDQLAADARIADRLIFDVPRTSAIASIVLRETPSAAGITIALK